MAITLSRFARLLDTIGSLTGHTKDIVETITNAEVICDRIRILSKGALSREKQMSINVLSKGLSVCHKISRIKKIMIL